jgi:hypothetical protein
MIISCVSLHSAQSRQGTIFWHKFITEKMFRGLNFATISTSPYFRTSIRWYNPQSFVRIDTLKIKERAKQLQLSERRSKTFKPALDHFRVTRFGWEHKKAGSAGERRRMKNHKACVLAGRVGYVSPRDYTMMRIYFPHVHVKLNNMPIDTNINLKAQRALLPVHIG